MALQPHRNLPISANSMRLSVPSNGAMALQQQCNHQQHAMAFVFQSPLTGQWPCNQTVHRRQAGAALIFQSPLTGQWPCNLIRNRQECKRYHMSEPLADPKVSHWPQPSAILERKFERAEGKKGVSSDTSRRDS